MPVFDQKALMEGVGMPQNPSINIPKSQVPNTATTPSSPDSSSANSVSSPQSLNAPADKTKQSFADNVTDAFNTQTSIGTYNKGNELAPGVSFFDPSSPYEQQLQPMTKEEFQKNIAGYEDHAHAFIGANTPQDFDNVKKLIDSQQSAQQRLSESGVAGAVASVAAGFVDPINWIPFTSAIKAATKVGTIAKSAAAGAASGAAVFGLSSGVASSNNPASENSPTASIAAGGIIGGVLGAIGGARATAISKVLHDTLGDSTPNAAINISMKDGKPHADVSSQFSNPTVEPAASTPITPKDNLSVGAAEVKQTTKPDSISRINETFLRAQSGFGYYTRPVIVEALLSPYEDVKGFANRLFVHNFRTEGAEVGLPVSDVPRVETVTRQAQNDVLNLNMKVDDLFKAVKAKQPEINSAQFNSMMAQAMRRGDTHEIPEVAAAAKEARTLMDKTTLKLQEAGLLDKELEVKTAQSYLTRQYNRTALIQDKEEFINTLINHFKQVRDNPMYAHGMVSADLKAGLAKATDEDIMERSQDTYHTLTGLSDQQLSMSGVMDNLQSKPAAKVNKARTLEIPDALIEKFLVNDAGFLVSRYVTQGETAVGFKNVLGALGHETIGDFKQALREQFDRQIINTPKDQREALTKQFKDQIGLVDDMGDIVLGLKNQSGLAPQLLGLWRKYNIVTMLGGVTLASIPDMGQVMRQHGIVNFVMDAAKPLFTSMKARELSNQELKSIGVGANLESNELLRMMTDPDYQIGTATSQIEGWVQKYVMTPYSKLTLMDYWNNLGERMAGRIGVNRTFKALDKYVKTGQMDKDERIRLSTYDIPEEMFKVIHEQMMKFGDSIDGVRLSGSGLWDDAKAKQMFEAHIMNEVRDQIIRPSRGDLPRWYHESQVGKTILQFKSFSLASSNKLIIRGIQDRNFQNAYSVVLLVALGTMSGYIRQAKMDESPTGLIAEGISRSGIAGFMGDYYMAMNPWSQAGTTKFGNASRMGRLLGPSYGKADDAMTVFYDVMHGDLSNQDKRKIKKFIPFSNLFYLDQTLKALDGDNATK